MISVVQRRPSLSSIQSSFRSYSLRSNNTSPYKNFKQIFTNFKRSNVRSTSDNLCESILVKPAGSFAEKSLNGQRLLRTTLNRDDKLTETKGQHLLNNHLHTHHHLNHHPDHRHSNHQLNHLTHHYEIKDFLRPTTAIRSMTSVNPSYYMSRTGCLSSNVNASTNASNQTNNNNVVNNILTSSVLHNNNVLKKCTKINEKK